MSLNNDFKKSVQEFISQRVILIPANIKTGKVKVSLVSLVPDQKHSCLMEYTLSGLDAECLQPVANDKNEHRLLGRRYFFTPLLNGCQLAIYKRQDGSVWVEHHNDIEEKNTYPLYLEQITEREPVQFYHFTPNQNYNPLTGLMVVGENTDQGWRFWVRYNVSENKGAVISLDMW